MPLSRNPEDASDTEKDVQQELAKDSVKEAKLHSEFASIMLSLAEKHGMTIEHTLTTVGAFCILGVRRCQASFRVMVRKASENRR